MTATLDTAVARQWFGEITLPAEPTAHEALVIVPDVDTDLRPDGPIGFSGGWRLIHRHTGHPISPRYALPVTWLRRFARLLADTGIDWAAITGEIDHVTHPQHLLVRVIGDHVLRCWLAGSPVSPWRTVSLHGDSRGTFHLACANPACADGFDGPAVLCEDTEDGDAHTLTGDPDELGSLAEERGWRALDGSSWLCADCAFAHRPPSPEVAASLRHVLDGSPA